MATFTVAVLLALWQAPAALVYLPVLGDLAPEVGFEFDPLLRFHAMANWVVRLPIMFGVGCTVYLPVRVVLQALTWYLSLFRRSPTREG